MRFINCIKEHIRKMNLNSESNMKKNSMPIYASSAVLISLSFLAVLYKPIVNTFFDDDLLWYIPILSFSRGLSFLNKLYFIFAPQLENPSGAVWKMYVFLVLSLFGPQAKYFIFVALLFHFASAVLVFLVGEKMGFDKRACFFSALMYLTFYIHYQAYTWAMAFQHLIVNFFILLLLYLYLKTDQLINSNRRYKAYYAATLVSAFLASLTRGSILILPILVFAHIIFCAKSGAGRIKKYNLWLPLLIISLAYPLLAIVFGSEISLPVSIRFCNFFSLITGLNPWLKLALSIALITVLGLILPGFILRIYQKIQAGFKKTQKLEKALRWSVAPIIMLLVIFFLSRVLKDAVVFSGLGKFIKAIPIFTGILSSFISPLLYALNSNNTFVRNTTNIYVDIPYILLAFLSAIIFLKCFLPKNRAGAVLLLIWFFAVSTYPGTQLVGSRYFIYITPVFALIFCAGITRLFDTLKVKFIANPLAKEVFLIVLFMIFFISNIAAIRVELFRNRLVNSFLLYDYIRMAQLIKEDLSAGNNRKIIPEDIYIDNVKPMPYDREKQAAASYGRPYSEDNIRYVFVQVFNAGPMMNIRINQGLPRGKDKPSYSVKDKAIVNKEGIDIDSFSNLLNEAKKEIMRKEFSRAEVLLKKAQEKKPFLLRYLLGKLPEKDMAWITNGRELPLWINTMADNYDRWYEVPGFRDKDEKIQYIKRLMKSEVNEYLQCIFFQGYLAHIAGKEPEDHSYFLELVSGEEISSLAQEELIASDSRMLSFLNEFKRYSTLKPYQRSGFNLVNVSFIRFIIARLFLL